MNVLPRRKFFRSGDVRDGSVRGGSVRGGRTFAAEVLPPRTMVLGKIFLADIFSANNFASSRRSPRASARFRVESASVRWTFAGLPAEFAGIFFWRIRGGRSSADPIASICIVHVAQTFQWLKVAGHINDHELIHAKMN